MALNSPAYLIWDEGADDEPALALLEELAIAHSKSKMPLLVMEVHDLIQSPESDNSQSLTPFVAIVAGGRSARERRARETLIKALRQVEIDLRHPEVAEQSIPKDHWLVQMQSNGSSISDPLIIGLPQIHRRNDGGIYPQIVHDLAVACGDAVLRAACAYLDDERGHAPAHYRSLGRSAFLKAALKADERLDSIAASFDFLLSVSPINTTAALEQFVADGESKAPKFRYRPLTVDPDEVKRRLYRLDFARLEDPLLQRLFTDKRHEIDAQLTMLATRNTPAFRPASLFLYGAVSAELLKDAQLLLAAVPPRSARGNSIGAAEVAAAARDLIGSYSRKDAFFDAAVEVRDDVSGLMVVRNRLLIGSSTMMTESRLDALLSHEVSTHLLTFINGSMQGLSIFRTGLANYEGIQEGLGVFAEWAVGGLTWRRLRLLAARVIAVDAMQHGAEFMDTYRLLRHDNGFSIAGAFGIATRVHRSGGLAKDSIYLEGFRSVINHIAAGGPLAPFWLGKIAQRDVPAIEELLQRGLVHAPVFLPSYLDRPDVKRRLSQLKAGIGLNRLLSMEPA
ncbi:DUF1704 domain-containing protein [Sphingomonas sp. HDW15A]|uniref:flavohemoglobin expression-modulating QEGLA motif protein n=1 Tax=Sphingomonas sp. HDW15A TaxID=2714942 RepID=UPI00140883BA|nr:tyrosine/phenylalanine carboxypeptidase domain-containing protein [Sphingomonas sp. HDW15A]QIK95898.1 DUF1704 domain-containing protein [Sphingomonas sp. HDW15A]